MSDISQLKTLLEEYGAQKTTIKGLSLPCDVYTLDPVPIETRKHELSRRIVECGFSYEDWCGRDHLEQLIAEKPMFSNGERDVLTLSGKLATSYLHQRNCIRSGNAIVLTNPHFKNTYGLLMEKGSLK